MLTTQDVATLKLDLDVEFQVFVHRKDVIENILSNARNDAHLVRVVQLSLKQMKQMKNR